MSADFTNVLQLEKPEYKTLRYDIPTNANWDLVDLAFTLFANGSAPGSSGNQPQIVLSEGVLWRDSVNNIVKCYSGALWEQLHSDSIVCSMKSQAAPASPTAGSLDYYASTIGGITVPTWKLSSGVVLNLQQFTTIAAINTTVLAALTDAYGAAADQVMENVTDTSATDQSGPINDNFQECTTSINWLNTVVSDIQSKLTTLLSNLQSLGIIA